MKAPEVPYFHHQRRFEENLDTSTPGLHKLIANVATKRRQIRRKLKCSNLFVEAVLSNTIRKAELDLALKQEIKRRNLQKFSRQMNIGNNYNFKYSSSYDYDKSSGDENANDDEIKSCLANIDTFFEELKQVKP